MLPSSASACARHMPVFGTADTSCKYIRFQWLATADQGGRTTAPDTQERKAHTRSGKFIWFGPAQPSAELQRRENPLRDERSGGSPVSAPTCRRKRCLPLLTLAFSKCSRISRETGRPVRREVSLSQA